MWTATGAIGTGQSMPVSYSLERVQLIFVCSRSTHHRLGCAERPIADDRCFHSKRSGEADGRTGGLDHRFFVRQRNPLKTQSVLEFGFAEFMVAANQRG